MTIEPPQLGGGISPVEWLRMGAGFDRRIGANARAREAEAIAAWIEKLTRREPAQ
jgi:hypothetical protein